LFGSVVLISQICIRHIANSKLILLSYGQVAVYSDAEIAAVNDLALVAHNADTIQSNNS